MSRANAESITIPFGVGICGNVAETKETINIKDAYEVMSRILLLTRIQDAHTYYIYLHTYGVVEYHSKSLILQHMRHFWWFLPAVYQEFAVLQQYYCRITHLPVSDDLVLYLICLCIPQDSRFNREIDVKTGYTTHSLVSMPVCNFDGEVIGVAQIMNKTNGNHGYEFSETDLKVFQRYLTFCGIGIQNAQLFEVSILEYKKNKVHSIVVLTSIVTLFILLIMIYFWNSFYFLWPKVYSKNRWA